MSRRVCESTRRNGRRSSRRFATRAGRLRVATTARRFDFNLKFAPQRSKVWVVYLAGGGACDDPIAGWYFAGHTNVAALLAVIEERDGLDDSDSETEVLFAGSSAGAFGPMVRPRGSSSRSFWFW
jgi:hypothetical protein